MSQQISTRIRKIPNQILDDISSKFLINLPEEESNDLIRIFFQIELAHWFFLDFFCTQEQNAIYSCGIKQFASEIFSHISFLSHHLENLGILIEEWRKYKMSVPTYGAILLSADMNNCLLVQSFFAKNSWSFPKGKVNQHEDPVKCAIREVCEETGFDCGHLINEQDYVEGQTSNFQYTRLYIVKNVPIETKFAPKTRNEIKDCSWFVIDLLPTNRNDDGYLRCDRKIRANSFYMILPFISKLKRWILNEQMKVKGGSYKKKMKHQQNNISKQNGGNHVNITQKQNGNGNNGRPLQSPFFLNNLDNYQKEKKNGNGKSSRHKTTSECLDQFNGTGTFYNDNAKLHENSSTPISDHNSFFHSNSSAFRSTSHSDTRDNANKKKPQQQQQQKPVIENGKNHLTQKKLFNKNEQENGKNQLTHKNLKLFNRETKESDHSKVKDQKKIEPFDFDIPECWKNFKFDRQKLLDCIYK